MALMGCTGARGEQEGAIALAAEQRKLLREAAVQLISCRSQKG